MTDSARNLSTSAFVMVLSGAYALPGSPTAARRGPRRPGRYRRRRPSDLSTRSTTTPPASVFLYVGSLVRNHLQTCSNCLPRTLGSGSRRANRSLNAATAGMLIDGYDV